MCSQMENALCLSVVVSSVLVLFYAASLIDHRDTKGDLARVILAAVFTSVQLKINFFNPATKPIKCMST